MENESGMPKTRIFLDTPGFSALARLHNDMRVSVCKCNFYTNFTVMFSELKGMVKLCRI